MNRELDMGGRRLMQVFAAAFAMLCMMYACSTSPSAPATLFRQLDAAQTGIQFVNAIEESDTFNISTYEYLYNGGGVAVGDVNNDGLPDIYFSGNMVANELYLNKGNLLFEPVGQKAGVTGRIRWKTGVSLVDINADGLLDIYVCYSGPGTDADRANEFYINKGLKNGVPQFEEQAKQMGLDAPGTFTTQCAFFDMDRDGDLDAVMVNHADMFYNVFYNTSQLRKLRNAQYGNRLYRNDNGYFTEVSEAAGIIGSGVNFGLGVAVDDVNGDNWPDIYVTNDYNEQDFLYLNNQDGTFKEVLHQAMGHISHFSMGVDISDLNNDGRSDIVTLDMLPEDNYRQKLLKGPEGYDYYQLMVDSGYHHQNMRNMLQLNMGVSTDGLPRFSEIGQLAGISNTDWSWAPIVADFDNDGHKDLYISNGYLRDFTNMDFLKYDFANAQAAASAKGDSLFAWKVIKDLKGTKISNYMYRNNGRLQFINETSNWGLNIPTVSTGAAYADFDLDGDLDLVVNNSNEQAMLLENQQQQLQPAHYVQLQLKDSGQNMHAIGASVRLWADNTMQQQTLFPFRGFQSSSQPVLHFGLGKASKIDSLQVQWPDGTITHYQQLFPDTLLVITKEYVHQYHPPSNVGSVFFSMAASNAGINYIHQSDGFVDFRRLYTLPHQISRQGPFMTVADVNGDGRSDVFIGGNDLSPARLFLQLPNGNFSAAAKQPWIHTRVPDGGVCFTDADGDGDMDLYVAKHGMQLQEGDIAYQHQVYQNDGRGNFSMAVNALPPMTASSVVVSPADYNKDGKIDLLVGSRFVPGRYPVIPTTYLLKNVSTPGSIRFEYAREQLSNELRQPGMVTAAQWTDINSDSWPDLILAGEFMPITLFINKQGQLTNETAAAGLAQSNGWWNSLCMQDVDNDGDVDIVGGNAGLNMQIEASPQQPVTLHYNDFDGNGSIDPFLTYYINNTEVPALGLDDAAEQTSVLRKKMLRYEQYAKAGWKDLFDAQQSKGAMQMEAFELQSCWWQNNGKGVFTKHFLPLELQFSSLQSIVFVDVNGDGIKEMIAAGNYFPWRTQWGKMDASYGWVMQYKNNNFNALYPLQTGLWLEGDVRALASIPTAAGHTLIATQYQGAARVWRLLPVRPSSVAEKLFNH